MKNITLLDEVWNTPLIKLERLATNPDVVIYAKMESHNPWWSVKDRPAYNMITEAMKRWDLKEWDTIVEATSWNTWIWLAMVGAIYGINVVLIMPETSTQERMDTMRAYWAELILTPWEEPFEYCRDLAKQLVQEKWYMNLDQFANDDNRKAHYKTTWPELWKQTDGTITHFVSAMWTTGTITWTGTYLKEMKPWIEIIWAEPTEESCIPWIRKWPEDYVPKIFNPKIPTQKITVSQKNAEDTARLLASKEGILCGVSSWGACWTALQVAQKLTSGVVVFIVCDSWNRYFSSWMYAQWSFCI